MNVEPSTLNMDEMNIDPTQTKALWEALFAITKAVEQLGLGLVVNGFRHVETDVGAFDFALAAIDNAVIDDDDCERTLPNRQPGDAEDAPQHSSRGASCSKS